MSTIDESVSAAERLDRIEAHLAVADLIHEYARMIRQDVPEEISALFTSDGRFEVRSGHPDKPEYTVNTKLENNRQLHDFYAPMKGKPHPVPLLRNIVIEVDGDTARANAVMDAKIYGTDKYLCGEYHDEMRRIDGRWLFSSRVFTAFAELSFF